MITGRASVGYILLVMMMMNGVRGPKVNAEEGQNPIESVE
jgi:hypothetical protein